MCEGFATDFEKVIAKAKEWSYLDETGTLQGRIWVELKGETLELVKGDAFQVLDQGIMLVVQGVVIYHFFKDIFGIRIIGPA